MARMTTKSEELARLAFAEKAAYWFADNPHGATFGDVEPGQFLALRWGIGNDCVLVVRIDENDQPVNYQQLIERAKHE